MIAALDRWQASSAILVPQMLHAMVVAAKRGLTPPSCLRYLAVGGAPVSASHLEEAEALGLPVHEGYGLSECASVVAVNRPGDRRSGTVGRPLPHVRLDFAPDGEILIRGLAWRGYLGEPDRAIQDQTIATGDLGHLDQDGYLHLTGRKKHMFITAYGRNVAPEWVESELTATPGIVQAAVFGEARPFNSAVIVVRPGATHETVSAALVEANGRLPDYARVHAWVPAHEPFSVTNGMATANGRPRRTAVWDAYADQIEALYRL
jgi:long-subunit acyl-CoA synthetase (AMP-forming)